MGIKRHKWKFKVSKETRKSTYTIDICTECGCSRRTERYTRTRHTIVQIKAKGSTVWKYVNGGMPPCEAYEKCTQCNGTGHIRVDLKKSLM